MPGSDQAVPVRRRGLLAAALALVLVSAPGLGAAGRPGHGAERPRGPPDA